MLTPGDVIDSDWIAGTFFALALVIAFALPHPDLPLPSTPDFDMNALKGGPPRQSMTAARVFLGGFERNCTECHRMFESRPETAPRIFQHQHIKLAHGMNDRCFNCHDPNARDRLRVEGTVTVGFDASERLCASCHGPTYRDWVAGMHGRTADSWQPGKRRHLTCVACHDPHHPAQPPLAPLPAPRTLRMGDPQPIPHDHHSPLMRPGGHRS